MYRTVDMHTQSISCVRHFVTPWTTAHQAPLFMGLPRQEYQSRLIFPPPGDLPNPEIEPELLMSPALAGQLLYTVPPAKYQINYSCVSCSMVCDSAMPWTIACRVPLSTEFSRQEYWSGLPFPSPGDLPDSGIEPRSPALQADSLPSEPLGMPTNTHAPDSILNHL